MSSTSNFTIAHICLANAFRDEQNEHYRFGKRASQFDRMFAEMRTQGDQKPGIVSMKELRTCQNLENTKTLSAVELAMHFAMMGGYALASCDSVKIRDSDNVPTYRPFYLAQLYDSSRFEKLGSVMHRYYEEIHGSETKSPPSGCAHLQCTYAPLENGQPNLNKRFMVETMHMPVGPESIKMKIAQLLNKNYNPYHQQAAVVRLGDLNTFQDKPEFAEYMRTLAEKFPHQCETSHLVDTEGNKMYGTFYPFPHDRTFSIDKPSTQGPRNSTLDHVFVYPASVLSLKGIAVDRRTYHDDKTMDQFDDSCIPLSDHLPLYVKLAFN